MDCPFQVLQKHSPFLHSSLYLYLWRLVLVIAWGKNAKSSKWQICHPNKRLIGKYVDSRAMIFVILLISCIFILQGTRTWIFDALHILAQWPCIEFCANHHSISKLMQSKSNLKHSHPYPFFESYNNDPCGKTLKNIHTKLPTSQPIHSTLNLAGDSDKRLLSTWSCVMISVQNGQSFNKIHQEKQCAGVGGSDDANLDKPSYTVVTQLHSHVTGMGNALEQEPTSTSSQINIFHQLGTVWSQSHLMGIIIQRVLVS